MDNKEKYDILEEVVKLSEVYAERREDEVLLMDYADRVKLSRNAARARLDKLVEKGILETRLATWDNKTVRVYRKAGE